MIPHITSGALVLIRNGINRKISKDIEDSIMKELKIEKQLIEDPEVPLRSYNYSYIKDRIMSNYKQKEG